MTTLREAAQQALEAMKKATGWMSDADYRRLNESIEMLRAALAQQPEPVAWSTHSEECWQWHQACAVAKVIRLQGAVRLAVSIVDDARRHGYALKHDEADALVERLRKVYEGRE